jgi:hypothetical protein
MPKSLFVAAACLVLAALVPATSRAEDEVASLHAAIDALKAEYSARIAELEQRVAQLESTSSTAASAQQVQSAPPAPAAGGGASAFNPAISVILGGSYANLSRDPADYRIAGFMPNGGDVGPGERSFSLGESEITLAANVDPYFLANLTASVSSANEISVEEAYFRTTALADGFTLKGGRFLSGIGYLNEVHAHAWDFVDQPLIYQVLYGSQLRQDGAQLKWVAPSDTFVEFGAEAGNGAAFPATRSADNRPNSVAAFVHLGGDVADSASWRAGLSWLDARADARAYADANGSGATVTNAFSGTSRTWIADATLKWAPHGDATRRQLKVQGEYLRRIESGSLVFDVDASALAGAYRSVQSGWYLQGVYQFRPRWRIGARFDALDSGDPRIGLVQSGQLPASAFAALQPAAPRRVSLMVDWSPSEFSRLRAQYALDDARRAARDRQLLLQYIYGIGAHGAHKF